MFRVNFFLLKSAFFIIMMIFFGMLYSCTTYRYVYVNKKEVDKLKKIYLLSVEIDNNSHLPKNQVIYYSSTYVSEAFMDGFMESFNENTNGITIELLDESQHRDLFKTYQSNQIDLEPLALLELSENSVMPVLIKGKWIKENQKLLDADGFATIQFSTSVWEQNAKGFLKIYDTNGTIIWREELKDFSPYILNDANSPYLVKNRQLDSEKINDEGYYIELKKVYQILGRRVSDIAIKNLFN